MKATQTFELKGKKRSLVKPFYKTEHPERLKPALWDLLYLDSYVPVIFFYRPQTYGSAASSSSSSLQFSEKVAHLKDSLSKVLVHYYPFAGRWIKTYDETVRALLCNDEGVPFFEAQIDEEMDTVIGDPDDFCPVPALGNFNLVELDNLLFQQDVDFPMPPIFFQATGFKCGGISLYGGFSHQATDGKGFFDFMAAWSQQGMQDQLAVTPVHDRALTLSLAHFMDWMNGLSDAVEPKAELKVQGVPTKGADALESCGKSSQPCGPEIESNNEISPTSNGTGANNGNHSSKDQAGKVSNMSQKTDPGADMRFPLQIPLSSKTLLVRKEAIQELKKEAIADNPNDYLTTVDCITSHIWRSLNSLESGPEGFHQSRTRSRPVQESKPVEYVISTAVDARKRCHDPALPDQYSPNCLFVFQTPRLAPAELLSKSHLQAARNFHKIVREIKPVIWKDYLKATLLILADYENCEFRHVLMTSWITFPMYNVEFQAGLGKPFFVGVNMEGGFLPEGYCVFLPPRPGSPAAANIQFGLQDDVLRALLSHQKFLSFFH